MRITSFLPLAAMLLATTTPVRAEWREVRTDHFVLTIDDTEESANAFATRLERFDGALRALYSASDTADIRSRPIHIYALKDRLFAATCGCIGVLGYYRSRANGSYILTSHMPKSDEKAKPGAWSSQTVLLHEYGHHFMYSGFPVAYPFWYSEGFAEFNANVSFEDDGSIILGYPANYRAEGMSDGRISTREMFEPSTYGFPDNMDALYGRGWLLTHYLMLMPQRTGQLSKYLNVLNRGSSGMDAARVAFGNLDKLQGELDAYRRGTIGAPLRIPAPKEPVRVTMRTLPEGEAAMLPMYLLFTDGISKNYRLGQAMRAAKIAERYPDVAIVQEQLAEIEYIAGRLDRADAAADRALELKPGSINALVQKGQVAVQRAQESKATHQAIWSAARGWFLKANRSDPNAVMPLYLYYASFVAAKAKPSPAAVNALMRAAVLAPESDQVRLALARQKLIERDAASAAALLQPIAYAPHLKRRRNIPREILTLVQTGKLDEAIVLMGGDLEEEEE